MGFQWYLFLSKLGKVQVAKMGQGTCSMDYVTRLEAGSNTFRSTRELTNHNIVKQMDDCISSLAVDGTTC